MMRHAPLIQFIRHLQVMSVPEGESSDGQLLVRFATDRDESAFVMILRRHGPMVLGVCRRILGDEQDAEDAFQQTFVILAREAAFLRKPESVGSWLHGVAHRVASRARAARAQRRLQERRAARPSAERCPPAAAVDAQDFWQVFDDELNRLPEKYRAVVVMCCLEGKTHELAARELGWPSGSVSRRLGRAREILRCRLTRRGFTIPAAWLILDASTRALAVPPPLAATVLRAALGAAPAGTGVVLGMGVVGGMASAKLTLVGTAVLVACLAGYATGVFHSSAANGTTARNPDARQLALAVPARDRPQGPRSQQELKREDMEDEKNASSNKKTDKEVKKVRNKNEDNNDEHEAQGKEDDDDKEKKAKSKKLAKKGKEK